MEIYITAVLKAKPEHLEEVITKLKNVVAQSRKEEANILYNLHQAVDDRNTLTLYEVWRDEAGLAAHNEQTYFKELGGLFETKLQQAPVILLTNLI
ncbi:MAG: antibiotic biosynthesis monooxygenase [Bacteroidales bacterium]|nr:antibiotic biosynthesis monooxygenase [Bacteroidales bacterium]